MGKVLTDEQIEFYRRAGYLYPLDGIKNNAQYSNPKLRQSA